MSTEDEYNPYDDESFEEYCSSDEEGKIIGKNNTDSNTKLSPSSSSSSLHKKGGGNVIKGELKNDICDLRRDVTRNIRKTPLSTEAVTFVAFHQTPTTLYHQYLKKICNLTASFTPSTFPVQVKEASCGTNSMHFSESSQTGNDDDKYKEANLSGNNKEVQCTDGFDDTFFETILQYCREEKYLELRTCITKYNRQADYDITVSRLPRFLVAASNLIERILAEEKRYRSIRAARRRVKGSRSSSTSSSKQSKAAGKQGMCNFQSDVIRDDDYYFIGKNQHRLFSCLQPQDSPTREVKRFLESKTISYVQHLDATKKSPIGLITVHTPLPLFQGNKTNSFRDSTNDSTYSSPLAAEENLDVSWYNQMTTICLWETINGSSTDSLTLSSNGGSLNLKYLLFGKGVVSCTVPLRRPNSYNLKMSSITLSSVIIACGTEEGSLALWDTDYSSSTSVTDVPFLDRVLKLLQLCKTTSIQVKMPIFHSDVNVQEHTSSTCQHYCKIVKLVALPHYDDTVVVPSRTNLLHECVLLASLDIRGVIILWRIDGGSDGSSRSLKCTPLCRVGLHNGDVAVLSNYDEINTIPTPLLSTSSPPAIEWLMMCSTSLGSTDMRLLFSLECSTVRRLDIQLCFRNDTDSSVTSSYTIMKTKKYVRNLPGKGKMRISTEHTDNLFAFKREVIATSIIVSPLNSEIFLSQWSDGSILLFHTGFDTQIMEWKLDNLVLLRDLLDYPIAELTSKTSISRRYLMKLFKKICNTTLV